MSGDDLARRITPRARWEDLILSDRQKRALRALLSTARNRRAGRHDAASPAGERRDAGLIAVFSGETGTGKTMAAEVLAAELGADVYRVDLSEVVNKYIGETEKHLHAVFEAAERAHAILFFDEADALFGKRSAVRDSHDRYANLDVNYLLQRIESYQGLTILSGNPRTRIDPALRRRLLCVVRFPLPSDPPRKNR